MTAGKRVLARGLARGLPESSFVLWPCQPSQESWIPCHGKRSGLCDPPTPMCDACSFSLPDPKAKNGMSAGRCGDQRWTSQRQMPTVPLLPALNYTAGGTESRPHR
jgi:hypothetical protein